MEEDHVILSECLEDQLKAVEWAREQKKKILEGKITISGNASSRENSCAAPSQ